MVSTRGISSNSILYIETTFPKIILLVFNTWLKKGVIVYNNLANSKFLSEQLPI